ncbi:MAG: transglutaminase domain-containing protein [Nonomuraea sp.]|nr:transglutaminase domain-containing protein [Nonomuraea sp.]NUP61398.1 transglutaminase domain-containing protein [Nonomuraea sp.]NUP80299.1 transglutaminase domain-containing protein [Nonomuraea sp.]NUS01242.1 transglutaminase domain-containing protein [Nonomuraea sp.]NUT09720.1 transglutaminase domain-containing protein [Nonomuraea sp.]
MTPDLASTEFLDAGHPVVREFAAKAAAGATTPTDRAVRLYYAVRDTILYDVYDVDMSPDGLRASAIISRGSGFCLHKSIVYAAAARSLGIPARLVFADVRNHLASERLKELVGGDVFRFHGMVTIQLEGRWVKATPVFNKTLCRLYRLKPLEFDGTADSVYHPYDEDGRRHMEFLYWHGEFDDFPYELVLDGFRTSHPRLLGGRDSTVKGSLTAEASV